jgi:hypothetical protein
VPEIPQESFGCPGDLKGGCRRTGCIEMPMVWAIRELILVTLKFREATPMKLLAGVLGER